MKDIKAIVEPYCSIIAQVRDANPKTKKALDHPGDERLDVSGAKVIHLTPDLG